MADLAFLEPGGRRPRPLLRTLVGEVLRRHRQEQRRTLAEVARAACVSVPYLSEVERGRKEASSEIVAAVCDSLGIELSDLLAEVRHELTADRAPVLRLDAARLEAARVERARLEAARLDPARLDPARLEAARLDAVRLRGARLRRRATQPTARPGDAVLLAA